MESLPPTVTAERWKLAYLLCLSRHLCDIVDIVN